MRKGDVFVANDGFQSTHPSGVRPVSGQSLTSAPDFNPRTPVGCDWYTKWSRPPIQEFQSTHPSGVRRSSSTKSQSYDSISIHAPQWGATQQIWRGVGPWLISIHAPQWGATITPNVLGSRTYSFQSTHPSGVRRQPPRQPRHVRDFNPRTPVGCDDCRPVSCLPIRDFNPRTPVGCDRARHGAGQPVEISIHAPQWGATPRTTLSRHLNHPISIHAPQWGATIERVHVNFPLTISIHAPQWGATA